MLDDDSDLAWHEVPEDAEGEVDELDEEMITEGAIKGLDDVAEHGAAIEAALAEATEEREQEVERLFEEKREEWADEQRTKVEDAMQVDF